MLRLHLLQLDQYFNVFLRKVGTFADGRLAVLDDHHLTVSKRTGRDGVGSHLLKKKAERVSLGVGRRGVVPSDTYALSVTANKTSKNSQNDIENMFEA